MPLKGDYTTRFEPVNGETLVLLLGAILFDDSKRGTELLIWHDLLSNLSCDKHI
jgi:hypothetical protein